MQSIAPTSLGKKEVVACRELLVVYGNPSSLSPTDVCLGLSTKHRQVMTGRRRRNWFTKTAQGQSSGAV